jgi:hypothetical protein
VSHPTPHTNRVPTVSDDEEPRYVSHPTPPTNAVFWHNTGSDADNVHLAVGVNAHVRAAGVNAGLPDHDRNLIDMLRSR